MHPNRRSALLIVLMGVLLFMVDRALKYLALSGVTAGPVNGGVRFELFQNPAIAFSIAFPTWASLTFIPVVLVLFTGAAVRLYRRGDLVRAAVLAVVVSAAVSNYLDRVQQGYVVDYVSVGNWLPVFNVSDAVMIAAIVAFIASLTRSSAGALKP